MSPSYALLETLVCAAIRAPSGDNVQPWRFILDPIARTISVYEDSVRDPSPINAGKRMALLACGAALENMTRTARNLGCEISREEPADEAVARVRIIGTPRQAAWCFRDDVLERRCTNRKLYKKRPVPDPVLAALRDACPPGQGVRTLFLTDARRRAACADADARATVLMYLQPSIRKAIYGNIRFSAPTCYTPDDGLPCASLELARIERWAFREMLQMPNWLLRAGVLSALRWYFRRLHRCSSGLCLITATGAGPETDLLVGQHMQRAWLALTELGLAVQPMMSVPVLEAVSSYGPPELAEQIGRRRIADLSARILSAVDGAGIARPAVLMRFGFAPAPTGRSGRRPISDVMQAVRPIRRPLAVNHRNG